MADNVRARFVTRRSMVAMVAASALTPIGRGALAQVSVPEAMNRLIASVPFAFPQGGNYAANEAAIDEFIATELAARVRAAEDLLGKSEAELYAAASAEGAALFPLFVENSVPLVPSPQELRALQPDLRGSDESLTAVIVDILIQTLELEGVQNILVVICTEYEPIVLAIEDLSAAIGDRNLDRVVRSLILIVQYLISKEMLSFLEARLGPSQAATVYRGFLRSIAKKFVPIIGWAILAASFVAVIVKNRDRIWNAVTK